MDNKLIKEDITNIKYLFGYKPGRVISEQDIDYTTDDHLDVDDTELDEDMFDGWDDPDNFKSTLLTKRHKLDLDDEDDDFDFLPDEDNDHRDEMTEQEEPKTDRYMFFSNLEQIHRQTGILLEKDPEMISEILDNGHDWAQDHISTSKETIDQVFDFLMNEENDEGDEDFEDGIM